jgi:flagellar motor switch protein FliM
MTNEVLSQAEVESLLTGGDAAATHSRSRDKVTRFDPRHTQRVVDDPLRALRTLHERFGRSFATALSELLRSKVEVALVGVDRLTYGQFVLSLDHPNCVSVLKAEPLEGNALASGGRKPPGDVKGPKAEPLEGNAVLEINLSILYPMIDRLLGGRGDTSSIARRPLTDIEQRLARRIAGVFLAELRRTWENVLPLDVFPLDMEVIRVESDPRRVEIASPTAIVVVIGFELTIAGAGGRMNLCIPSSSVEGISDKLSRHGRADDAETIDGKGALEFVVRLAHSSISSGELTGLEVGDIITTETSVHRELIVEVEGIGAFHVRPGAFEGRKAVRIADTLRGLHTG